MNISSRIHMLVTNLDMIIKKDSCFMINNDSFDMGCTYVRNVFGRLLEM